MDPHCRMSKEGMNHTCRRSAMEERAVMGEEIEIGWDEYGQRGNLALMIMTATCGRVSGGPRCGERSAVV